MTFKFSKELIDEKLRLYTIFDDKEQIAGQFYYHKRDPYFAFGDTKISIGVVSKLFGKTQYHLVDNNTYARIGGYEFFGAKGIVDRFFQALPTHATGAVNLQDKKYHFRRIPAEVEHKIFKKNTWGYFRWYHAYVSCFLFDGF